MVLGTVGVILAAGPQDFSNFHGKRGASAGPHKVPREGPQQNAPTKGGVCQENYQERPFQEGGGVGRTRKGEEGRVPIQHAAPKSAEIFTKASRS